MKNKTVYLHIGSFKTGTSSLQYFLLKNREALSRKGISYPKHSLDDNGVSSGNAEKLAKCLRQADISEVKKMIEDALSSRHSTIVLSSEYFYRSGRYTSYLKELLSGVKTKVIIYLRRPDSVFISAYNQGVKRANVKIGVTSWINKQLKKDHKEISHWSCFGKENVIVRVYEPQQFIGGSIFSDFLEILGHDLTSEFKLPPKRINTAYRIDALETMRVLNCLPFGADRLGLDSLLQSYSEEVGKEGDWPYPLLSPVERLKIIDFFAEGNAAIAKEFLGRTDGRLFYEPLPDPNEAWKPYPGLSKTEIKRIASFIVANDPVTSQHIGEAIIQGLDADDSKVQNAAEILSPGLNIFMNGGQTFENRIKSRGAEYQSMMKKLYNGMPPKVKKTMRAVARRLRIIV